MPEKLSWNEAIHAVLSDAKQPMSSQEIVDEIVNRGLHPETGATPSATVGSLIYTSIQKYGPASPFTRPVPGKFALRNSHKDADDSAGPEDLNEKSPEQGTSQTSGIVNALGMFWERSKVNFAPSQPKLLGLAQNATIPTDFCAQRGIYLLHDNQGVVYVGRTTDRSLGVRLREHTTDRLNGRWDRFSWFGIFPVTGAGTLNSTADFSGLSKDTVIVTLEAVLIEALEPRQNRKGGDWKIDAIEFLQREDPEFELKRKKAIVEELMKKGLSED